MSDLHPLYRYGPLGFLIASAIVSAALTPRFVRIADHLKERATDRRLRRYGLPRRSLVGVADGETVSIIGVLGSGTAKRYELALEHAEDTHETVRLVPDLEVLFEGRRIPLTEDVAIEGGSDEVVSGTSRWRRLSIGDRIHVTGEVSLGEVEKGSFRESARAMRLVGRPMTPVRVAYASVAPWRRPRVVKAGATLASAVALWVGASLVALVLLLVPSSEIRGRLPGDHVDLTLIAHSVPPVSGLAAKKIARRLERDGGVGRYSPPGALEARLEQAARVDEIPEVSFDRWLRNGFPSRAGKVALGNPSVGTCGPGLLAFADSLRVGGVAQLRLSCASIPSDDAADAAFMIGDFSSGHGPEPETIVFRQPIAPIDGAPCLAGGDDPPPSKEPVCVLIHAEMKPKKRRELLLGLSHLVPYAERWVATARAIEGDPYPDALRWTIDPELLLRQPVAALFDQPLAPSAELWEKKATKLPPADRLWVGLGVAAERSAFGHHEKAVALAEELMRSPDLSSCSSSDGSEARLLAVAIALRAGDVERASRWAEPVEPSRSAPLLAVGAFLRAPSVSTLPRSLALDVPLSDGVALAELLSERDGATNAHGDELRAGFALALRAVPDGQRGPVREWLREGYPRFRGARFFVRAEVLVARLDAAHALGDTELAADIEPILARFEAVVLHRTLALSLRAGTPEGDILVGRPNR